MRLQGKTAIVTGGGNGMGRAISVLFAAEGADVVVVDIDADAGQETVEIVAKEGGQARFSRTDVTSPEQLRALVGQTVTDLGKLDILVNNAGGGISKDMLSTTEEDFDRQVDLNLKAVFFGCRYAIEAMRATGGGSIVSTASITGMRGQDFLGAYGAAKAGVINLTKHIAWAYGPYGIRANCVCPGAVATGRLADPNNAAANGPVMSYLRHQAPLHRIGQPGDIAQATLFFASDESAHVTGQALPVDGGIISGTFLDPARITEFAADALRTE